MDKKIPEDILSAFNQYEVQAVLRFKREQYLDELIA
ncbi:hypothetical protein [Paenibacillus yonginensis]|nr:hypothetical protein [Paenibacillus yonginensis]